MVVKTSSRSPAWSWAGVCVGGWGMLQNNSKFNIKIHHLITAASDMKFRGFFSFHSVCSTRYFPFSIACFVKQVPLAVRNVTACLHTAQCKVGSCCLLKWSLLHSLKDSQSSFTLGHMTPTLSLLRTCSLVALLLNRQRKRSSTAPETLSSTQVLSNYHSSCPDV